MKISAKGLSTKLRYYHICKKDLCRTNDLISPNKCCSNCAYSFQLYWCVISRVLKEAVK